MQKKDETRRYESVTLGLPPLKMVLVHTDEERVTTDGKKTSVLKKSQKELDNLKAVVKLISHLSDKEK